MHPIQQGIVNKGTWVAFKPESTDKSSTAPAVENIDQQEAFQPSIQENFEPESAREEQHESQVASIEAKNALLAEQNKLLSQFTEKINDTKLNLSVSLETECKKIVEKVVKGLLQQELSVNPEKLNPAIHQALELLTRDQKITLYTSKEAHENLLDKIKTEEIDVKIDPKLSITDFYVTQGHTKIDGKLSARIEQSIKQLFGDSKS